MERRKTVKKFVWRSPYDLTATERWLEEQAGKGLLLRKFGERAVFDDAGQPRQVHYRLEPISPALPRSEEREAAYAEGGWREACAIGDQFRVWYNTQPEPAELHTDPVALAWAFRSQEKRTWKLLLFFLFLSAGLWLWFLWPAMTTSYGLASILEAGDSTWLFLNCYSLLLDLGLALRLRQLRRTRRSLEAGVFPAGRKRPILNAAALTSCALLILGTLFLLSSVSWLVRRPELEWGQVPFLSLGELETGQGLPEKTVRPNDPLPTSFPGGFVITAVSYESTADSHLSRFYAVARRRFLAAPYARAWAERERDLMGSVDSVTETEAAGFDHAWTGSGPGGSQLFAGSRNSRVVVLRYRGEADLLAAVEAYDWAADPLTG